MPYYLGLMANSDARRRDYVLAMSLYKKASELGWPEALFRIGALFAAGRGVAKNQNEAMQYYIRAAELGSNLAQDPAGMGYLSRRWHREGCKASFILVAGRARRTV